VRRALPAAFVLAVLAAGGVALSAGAAEGSPSPSDPAATPAVTVTPTPSPTPTPIPTPQPKPVKAPTAVTLTVAPARVQTGKSVTLSGVAGPLRSNHVVPLARARITLQYRPRGATSWTRIRVLIAPSGRFRVAWRYALRTSSSVRAVLSAGTTTASAVSPSRVVTRLAPLPAPRAYPNCKALNVVYPHGVGRQGAIDHTSGTPVTTFVRDAATYRLNPKRDGDHDGIACEKR
jgi:Excalibur calcium-binding domain